MLLICQGCFGFMVLLVGSLTGRKLWQKGCYLSGLCTTAFHWWSDDAVGDVAGGLCCCAAPLPAPTALGGPETVER